MKQLVLIGLVLLASCEKNEFTIPAPVGGGSGGYSYQQPKSTPMAPSQSSKDPGNIEGQQETHAVSNKQDCDEMARKFRQQGRRVQLVERRFVGGQLPYLCIFEGEDAQPGYFEDNRYR